MHTVHVSEGQDMGTRGQDLHVIALSTPNTHDRLRYDFGLGPGANAEFIESKDNVTGKDDLLYVQNTQIPFIHACLHVQATFFCRRMSITAPFTIDRRGVASSDATDFSITSNCSMCGVSLWTLPTP